MTAKPISVQLYSLRDASAKDFKGTLKRVADIGYAGVEPAGFYGLSPKEFRSYVDSLGLKISSSHSPWCTPDSVNEVIDTAGILGVKHVTCGYGPNEFATVDAIKKTADMVNGMLDRLKGSGLTLIQHNHFWEFESIDGQLKYDIFAKLCPGVQFELDMYWVSNFGTVDAPKEIGKFAKRTPFLHVKDGPLVKDKPMLPAGEGKVNIPACIAAADPDVLQWLVVELDAYDGDMFTVLDVLAEDVGVLGVFSDWPATVTYYANCKGL